MIPEIDTQLSAVLKSLTDNVLPAVDTTNPMAAEQIQLCLATVGLIKANLPHLHRYLRRDLETQLALAQRLRPLADQAGVGAVIAPMIDASVTVLGDPEQGASEIEQQVRQLKKAIVALIAASRGNKVEGQISAAIIDAEAAAIQRNRAWTVGMGFEPDPSQLPSLDKLLNKD
jgi:hypothetical protein